MFAIVLLSHHFAGMRHGYTSLLFLFLFLFNYLIATATVISYYVAEQHQPHYARLRGGFGVTVRGSPQYVIALDPHFCLTICQDRRGSTPRLSGIFESTEAAVLSMCWDSSGIVYARQFSPGVTLPWELVPGMTILVVVGCETRNMSPADSLDLLHTAARQGAEAAWQRINSLGLSQGVSLVHIRIGTDASVATIETRQVQALENTNQPLTMAQHGIDTSKGQTRSLPDVYERSQAMIHTNHQGFRLSWHGQEGVSPDATFLEPGTWVMRLDCTEEEHDGPFIVASTRQASNTCILLNLHGQYEMTRMRYCLRRCTYEEFLDHAEVATPAYDRFSVGDCVMVTASHEWSIEGPFRVTGFLGNHLLALVSMKTGHEVSSYAHHLRAHQCTVYEQNILYHVDPIFRNEFDRDQVGSARLE